MPVERPLKELCGRSVVLPFPLCVFTSAADSPVADTPAPVEPESEADACEDGVAAEPAASAAPDFVPELNDVVTWPLPPNPVCVAAEDWSGLEDPAPALAPAEKSFAGTAAEPPAEVAVPLLEVASLDSGCAELVAGWLDASADVAAAVPD